MNDRFSRISGACADENFKAIYGIFADKAPEEPKENGAKDGATTISFSDYEVDEIKRLQFESVKAFVKDGFYNPGSGFGTDIDVGNWGRPYEPLLIGPYDASAMYSSGGLSQIIIDKKSRGLVISGYEFTSGKMEGQELLELRDYAEAFGFSSIIAQAARDALLFGGSSIWAILKGDTAVTTAMSFAKLLEAKLLRKDCLDYFAEADRWNMTVIPDYDLSAKDYLNPRTFMVPISGIEVNSDRAAFVRTKPLPYWSAIRQLGWGASDITGWAKSLIGYEIMAMSLPIMCQQMSLLVHTLPLDGIIAQNGVKAAKAWQKENEREMRDWSILNPKAINSYGEISVVNRNYTGFDSLIDAIRKDIADIFHTRQIHDHPLETESETRMLATAVSSGIQIPFISGDIHIQFFHPGFQEIQTFFSLRTAYQFTDMRHQQVAGCHGLSIVVLAHIERLDVFRIIRQENRSVDDFFTQITFMFGIEVHAPADFVFEFDRSFQQQIDRFRIAHSAE